MQTASIEAREWKARAEKAEADVSWHEAETNRYKVRLLESEAARLKAEAALREVRKIAKISKDVKTPYGRLRSIIDAVLTPEQK
jgi:multidrug resistance efflux pump